MRHTRTLVSTVALALGLALTAQAQPHHDRRGPGHGARPHHAGPPPAHVRPPHHRPPHAAGRYPGWRPPPPPPPHVRHGHAYRWAPGMHVPPAYRVARYRVPDWRRHGLYAPPHGHYWVRHGADYLLVAVTTGVIAGLIAGAY